MNHAAHDWTREPEDVEVTYDHQNFYSGQASLLCIHPTADTMTYGLALGGLQLLRNYIIAHQAWKVTTGYIYHKKTSKNLGSIHIGNLGVLWEPPNNISTTVNLPSVA